MEPTAEQKAAFSDALKRARKAAKLTGKQVAAALTEAGYETSHQSIYQWENNQGAPGTRAVLDLLDEIVGGNGSLVSALLGDSRLSDRIAKLEKRAVATERRIDEILRRLEAR